MEQVQSQQPRTALEEMMRATRPLHPERQSLFRLLLEIESELRRTARRDAQELQEKLRLVSTLKGNRPSRRAERLSRYVE